MAQTSRFTPGNNRKVYRQKDHTEYWLHNTCIVRVYDDGRIKLHSGGWRSATTKLAMNQVSAQFNLGFHVSQAQRDWYVTYQGDRCGFLDDMVLHGCHINLKTPARKIFENTLVSSVNLD